MSVCIDSWVGKEFFLERYEQGRLLLSHVINFLQERCRGEEEYQKRLEKLDKFNKTRVITEHWTLGEGWSAFEKWAEGEEKLRSQFCTSLNDILTSAFDLRKDLQNTKQNLTNEMSHWERGREKTYYEMVKSIQKCRAVAYELEQARAAVSHKQGENGESKKKEIIKLTQKVATLEKEKDATNKQAKQHEQEYKIYLKKYQLGMKKVLNNFAELDARRIIRTKDLLSDFLQLNVRLGTQLQEYNQTLQQSLKNINERIDVNTWVRERLPPDYIMSEMDYAMDTFSFDLTSPPSPITTETSTHSKLGTIGRRKKKCPLSEQNLGPNLPQILL